ncbi:MAG TPA: hypothetical protein VN493_02235 [Thermoanaerobaculia bacterium]|nr:hypothetical protein [Thermoanaerobaculia bacterium]
MEPRTRHLLGRLIAVPFTLLTGFLAVEALWYGAMLAGAASQHGMSLEDIVPLAGGLTLVALCAAGVKYSLNLRFRYWIVFAAVLLVVFAIVLAVQAGVFLG